MVELLTGFGADLNQQIKTRIKASDGNKVCHTALMLAIEKEYTEIADLLTTFCDDSINDSQSHHIAYSLAYEKGHTETTILLCRRSSDCYLGFRKSTLIYVALVLAIRRGHNEIARLLISANPGISMLSTRYNNIFRSARNIFGYTALMLAAEKEHTEIAKFLIDSSANFDLQSESHCNALMIAVKKGHTEIAKLLINAGANFDMQNDSGNYCSHTC